MEWYKKLADEFKCAHECAIPVKFTKSNGVVCVRIQCQRCGDSQGERKKADYDLAQLPDWNEDLRTEWRADRNNRWTEERENDMASRQAELLQQNAEWWAKYSVYLRSQQWHRMRQKVLDRDGNLCQSCLTNTATHVHHLSYELYNQIGKSAAFELVAICRSCHQQIHPHMSEEQDRITLRNPFLNGETNGKHR